ncbi:hypothetical protein CRYUN_Cryun11dG0050700 [Craigia yunnanensis]
MSSFSAGATGSDGAIGLPIGFATGVVFLVIVFKILSRFRKEDKSETRTEQTENNNEVVDEEAKVEGQTVEMFLVDMIKEKPVRFSSQQLEIFTSNYSTRLGNGGFGEVYKGQFPNGAQLAVKVLNNNGLEKRIEEQFMAEVNTIGRTYHRNLVRLFGFCFDAKTKALVYEYMENGSLDKVLFKRKYELEWEKLYEIAMGAAKGLEYLHHYSHRRIIHYDIKPGNVLLDSKFCPKIADFGLAKLCNRDNSNITLSGGRGTPGYAAPELWMPFPVSYKCDVYSFGMMLFEIVGRRRNLDLNLSDQNQEWFPRLVWEKFNKGELEELLMDNGIEEKNMEKAKVMSTTALWCVQYLPEARPSMINVVKNLEGGAELATPQNPFQHLVSLTAEVPTCRGSSSNSTIECETTEDDTDYSTTMKNFEIESIA